MERNRIPNHSIAQEGRRYYDSDLRAVVDLFYGDSENSEEGARSVEHWRQIRKRRKAEVIEEEKVGFLYIQLKCK